MQLEQSSMQEDGTWVQGSPWGSMIQLALVANSVPCAVPLPSVNEI